MIKAPRGTEDLYGNSLRLFNHIISTARCVRDLFGYEEVMTPVFEEHKLFERGIGEVTDIVQKEMFTFGADEKQYVLRPELTAPVARFILEKSLHKHQDVIKLFYAGPMFRKERPQKGRQRQFHQIGIECIGPNSPEADAEVILFYEELLKRLNITGYMLYVNSIGCRECRSGYREELRRYYRPLLPSLCDTCRDRYERNIFRLLDCKNEGCREKRAGAPVITLYLCDTCGSFHEGLKSVLDACNVKYEVDNYIMRGFDYYMRNVFEWRSDLLGAQSEACGGGRYDNLFSDIGGDVIPGVGFASGIERMMIMLQGQESVSVEDNKPDVYCAYLAPEDKQKAFSIAGLLRSSDIKTVVTLDNRSLKSQMRQANKLNAKYVCIIGGEELKSGKLKLKEMGTGSEKLVDENEIIQKIA